MWGPPRPSMLNLTVSSSVCSHPIQARMNTGDSWHSSLRWRETTDTGWGWLMTFKVPPQVPPGSRPPLVSGTHLVSAPCMCSSCAMVFAPDKGWGITSPSAATKLECTFNPLPGSNGLLALCWFRSGARNHRNRTTWSSGLTSSEAGVLASSAHECVRAVSYPVGSPRGPLSDPYADAGERPSSWSVSTCSPALRVADHRMVMASLTLWWAGQPCGWTSSARSVASRASAGTERS